MKREDSLLWSALAFMFGCLVIIFSAVLHSRYAYNASYDTALHVHFRGIFILIAGGVIALLGLIGMISVIASEQ